MMTSKEVNQFIEKARDIYAQEGAIEIDDPPNRSVARRMISEGPEWRTTGVYVKAWVWVPVDDLKEETET